MGRSEMVHGTEFLVGNNDTSSNFSGLSFDGVWLTYGNENFGITGFWTRLAQDFTGESSGDADFSGIYGTYTGLENMTIDGYYYYYHEAANSSANAYSESRAFHTIGARFAGTAAQFDWEANLAYQTGDSGATDLDVEGFGIQGALGYTFDVNMQPRIFINGAYYSGPDDNYTDETAFQRLFSDHEYSEFLDNGDLSNIWFVGGGVGAQVTEAIGLTGVVNYFEVVEEFSSNDSDLGLEVALYARYDYSEDLYFQAGYAHFFAGDGVEDTAFLTGGPRVSGNGFVAIGGNGESDDIDYLFLETGISF
jgi:hypothetical protein